MFEDKKWDLTFKNRLTRHYDEMKWLYASSITMTRRPLTTSAI